MPRKPKRRPQAGIYTRPRSPFWWAEYPNGRGGSTRRSTEVRCSDDPQGLKAAAVRAAWIADKRIEQTGNDSTFDDLMLLYLDQVTPTKRAPERDGFSAKALFPTFTGKRLSAIGAAEVRGYIASRTKAGAAPGTINKETGLMSSALNWARKELEWDVPNPWQSRRQREPNGRNRWLTHEEAEQLLNAAASRKRLRYPWLRDFIRLGLYSGLRPGEMLWLEWRRVDLKGAAITFEVETSAGQKNGQKNGKAGRVPINREAREAMLARARFRAEHCPGSPWVFCRRDGSRIDCIKKGFAACVADAGLSDVHPHDLRRTFGSWLVQAGVGIERVSELLRHSDIRITAKVYAHLRPDDLASAAAILDRPAAAHTEQNRTLNRTLS
jgi:integrase